MSLSARGTWLSLHVLLASLACFACSPGRRPLPERAAELPTEAPPPPTRARESHRSNASIASFEEAKRALRRVYESHKIDLYCGCTFFPDPGTGLRVDWASCGYAVARDHNRASRIEWEHAVAAATFGHTFVEWTEGSKACVASNGRSFRGRKCAETSPEFSRIEGDMHNLFPVVGEVNALRGDLPMGQPDDRVHHASSGGLNEQLTFGQCGSTIDHGVFHPRPQVRGDLARAALYMEHAYPTRAPLSSSQRAMFARWAELDPPDAWERERNDRIARLQGNRNPFIDEAPPLR